MNEYCRHRTKNTNEISGDEPYNLCIEVFSGLSTYLIDTQKLSVVNDGVIVPLQLLKIEYYLEHCNTSYNQKLQQMTIKSTWCALKMWTIGGTYIEVSGAANLTDSEDLMILDFGQELL